MSTSANVTYYEIFKDGNFVDSHSQNCMCKNAIKEKLSKYIPALDYKIRLRWLDENEANHYTNKIRLSDYFSGKKFEWLPYE